MFNHISERMVRAVAGSVLAAVGVWLIASLWLVNIEFDDGYTTVVNSQYLLGLSPDYFWQRGPLLAALLIPAEFLANLFDLHPLNVRPHHAVMVAIHFIYLWGVWRLLVRHYGCGVHVLLAFVAAVPTVVYFSYAPFISHDIFPGLIALAMLILADDYLTRPNRRTWFMLAGLGCAVALVKQTYAAIWVAVLVANALVLPWRAGLPGAKLRIWFGLSGAAALSGVLTWCLYAWSLSGSFLETPWLLRPYVQAVRFVEHFQGSGSLREIIYQWVYLRNLSAYGIAAMAFVWPAIFLALRGNDRLLKSVAVAWLLLFAIMNVLAFKEVRYLAYLAPLTAFLLAPALLALGQLRRAFAYGFVLLLAVDLWHVGVEAARIANPYYRNAVTDFLAPLPLKGDLAGSLVMTERLNFVSPEPYAFFGDRYHRITNIIDDQIRMLYGYRRDQVVRFPALRDLHGDMFAPGSVLIFVNDVAARVPPIRPDNATSLQASFVQLLAVAEKIRLRRAGDSYVLAAQSRQPILLLPERGQSGGPLTSTLRFSVDDIHRAIGSDASEIEVTGFRVLRSCNLQGCIAH